MFKYSWLCGAIGVLTAAGWIAAAPAPEELKQREAQAKETVEQFMKGMKAEEIDAVMKVVATPFFWDGKSITRDGDSLKKQFEGVFADKDLTQIDYEIKEIHTFAAFGAKMSEAERGLLKEVLDKDDQIAVLIVKSKGREHGLRVMVRTREGKSKVVGFRD